MRWRGERQSSNIEDRRGLSGGKIAVGGGLGTVLILIIALIFGADPRQLLEQLPAEPFGALRRVQVQRHADAGAFEAAP